MTEDADAGRSGSLTLGSSLNRTPRWTQEAFRSSSDVVLMPHWHLAAVWALYTTAASYCEEGKPSEAAFCWNLEMSSLAETFISSQLDLKISAWARKDTAVPGAELCGSQVISKQYLQSLYALKRPKPHVFRVFWQLSAFFLNVPQGSWCYCLLRWSTIPIKFWINWKLTSQIPSTKAEDLFRVNTHIKPGSLKAYYGVWPQVIISGIVNQPNNIMLMLLRGPLSSW